MKKVIKRTISFLFVTVLIFSSCCLLMADEKEEEVTGKVTERTISYNDNVFTCYFFAPDDSEKLGKRATTNPVIMIFGNEDYNEDSALETAKESGLGKVAKDEGCVIAFVNWSNVENKEAVALYKNVAVMYSDNSDNNYVNGFWSSISTDSTTGEEIENGKYCGTGQRIYVYGEGKGADFVADNYLIEESPISMTEATVTLFNPTKAIVENQTDLEFPIAVVNGLEKTEDILKTYSDDKYFSLTSTLTSGFDSELVTSLYKDLSGKYRRQSGVILEIPDYENLGITETLENMKLTNGDVEYYQYIPDDLNMDEDTGDIPLVLVFHGRFNHAEYQSWASEWPLIGKENGFMVISVNNHDQNSPSDIIELLDYLLDEYPALDSTRVYATGFSMGAIKSWNLAEEYADRFAGIVPMSGSFLEVSQEIPDVILPVFYVGGEATMVEEFPSQANNGGESNAMDLRIDFVLKMNNITDSYSFDSSANKWFGIAPDETETIENPSFEDSILTLYKYKSEDGNIYTEFGSVSNKQHEVFAFDNRVAWEFISKFSRNADGTISIEGVSDSSPFLYILIPVILVVIGGVLVVVRKRKK